MSPGKTLDLARSVVANLFANPPMDVGELRQRFSGIPKDDVRRALVELLERQDLPTRHLGLFCSAIGIVKPGNLRSRISAVVLDESRSDEARSLALGALLQCDRAEATRLAGILSEATGRRLAAVPIRNVALGVVTEVDPAHALIGVLGGDAEMDGLIVFGLEEERRDRGVSAAELYGPALQAGLLAAHRTALVQAMGAEGGQDAIDLLDRLRDSPGADDAFRRACQDALLRARSAAIAAKPAERKASRTGRAWLTPCDGQGAFILFAEILGRPGSDPTLANLCIRASGGVRDGFTIPVPPGEAERTVMGLDEFGTPIPIPLGIAAALAAAAVARSNGIPKDARRAVKILGQVEAETLPDWPVEPSPLPSFESVLATLPRERHRQDTWFFDDGDLAAGSELPEWPETDDPDIMRRCLRDTTAAIDVPEMRARVVEMCRHEARGLAWNGRPEEAAWFTALGQDAERHGLATSPIAQALVLRGFADGDDDDDDLDDESVSITELVGDAGLRSVLRAEFFADVEKPTGRDLARLDFAEAAWSA